MEYLIRQINSNASKDWIIWNGITLTYNNLIERLKIADEFLLVNDINPGQVIALIGDFTPNTIAILIALIKNKNIIVPFALPLKEGEKNKFEIAEIEGAIEVNIDQDTYQYNKLPEKASHTFYKELRNSDAPGLVLFTSGTSGFPKAAVHNFRKLLLKFESPRKSMRTINFLLFDHWGGLNTLFHTLYNSGLVLALKNRKPENVCEYIENHKIELLPTSPSFLNLLLLSQTFKNYDLSSLKLVTYGTEPMPQSTLERAKKVFNWVIFQQTYGLIELGVLSSKSKEDGSLWVKLGGKGYNLRVVDNLLEIKADSAMMGYLNYESPFTEDGYFKTGDMVEQDGEYYKILGRKSEIINVGGEKVYPQEVENILLDYPGVIDATVFGKKHVMMGNVVHAKINVGDQISNVHEFLRELKTYCKKHLQSFKIPVKIEVVNESLFSGRFKKQREK